MSSYVKVQSTSNESVAARTTGDPKTPRANMLSVPDPVVPLKSPASLNVRVHGAAPLKVALSVAIDLAKLVAPISAPCAATPVKVEIQLPSPGEPISPVSSKLTAVAEVPICMLVDGV